MKWAQLEVEIEHQQDLVRLHLKRRRALELRSAQLGNSTPPEVIVEIEDINNEIERFQTEIEVLRVLAINSPEQLSMPMVERQEHVEKRVEAHRPPESAEYLLWYLPRAVRNDVMGDLAEEFTALYNRFGERKAIIWYYYQVGASFYPFAVAKVQKLAKWGVLAWVGESFRRYIS